MSQNFYLMQKLAETHRHELMREAEQQLLVARLPRQRNGIAAKLGAFFTMLGTSMKQFGRMTTRKPVPTTAPLSLGSPHR